jgi:hypothetical protein
MELAKLWKQTPPPHIFILPTSPNEDSFVNTETKAVISVLQSPDMALPPFLPVHVPDNFLDSCEDLGQSLLHWVQNCCAEMSSSRVFRFYEFSSHDTIMLCRAIWYIHARCRELDESFETYKNLINTVSAYAMMRYTRHVLVPVAQDLMAECEEDNHEFLDLVALVHGLIGTWEEYALLAIPEELKVSEPWLYFSIPLTLLQSQNYIFESTFPSIPLDDRDADAISFTLSKFPWWRGDVQDYPILVETSNYSRLTSVLGQIPLKQKWQHWKVFDRFLMMIMVLTVAIRPINLFMDGLDELAVAEKPHIRKLLTSLQNELGASKAELQRAIDQPSEPSSVSPSHQSSPGPSNEGKDSEEAPMDTDSDNDGNKDDMPQQGNDEGGGPSSARKSPSDKRPCTDEDHGWFCRRPRGHRTRNSS